MKKIAINTAIPRLFHRFLFNDDALMHDKSCGKGFIPYIFPNSLIFRYNQIS